MTGACCAERARYALRSGDDALVLAHRCGEWIANAPAARGGRRARQHRPRPARPGPDAAHLRRRGRGPGRDRGRPRLPARGARVHERAARRAAQRRLRRHHGPAAGLLDLPAGALRRAARSSPTRRSPASPARRSRRSPTTATTRRAGCSGSATAPSVSHARMQAGLDARVAVRRGALRRRLDRPRARSRAAWPSTPAQLRPEWEAYLRPVLAEATLDWPDVAPRPAGGRRGSHTEAMGYLLAEMQHLHRSHPGAPMVTATPPERALRGRRRPCPTPSCPC